MDAPPPDKNLKNATGCTTVKPFNLETTELRRNRIIFEFLYPDGITRLFNGNTSLIRRFRLAESWHSACTVGVHVACHNLEDDSQVCGLYSVVTVETRTFGPFVLPNLGGPNVYHENRTTGTVLSVLISFELPLEGPLPPLLFADRKRNVLFGHG